MKQKIFFVVVVLLNQFFCSYAQIDGALEKPRVSIITSLYNGDEFIAGFLSDITRQTIFNQCELIIINANSPGNEEGVIQEYMQRFPNIVYKRLIDDPGLYAVWNMGIKMARADFITNANIDDRRNPESLAIHAAALEQNSKIDLVYSEYRVTEVPNESFEHSSSQYTVYPCEFSPNLMHKCLPGPQPMWRKSLHDKYGYFDESFKSAGDFEMWNRAASKGAQFKRVPGISGLYYVNPQGLSTDVRKKVLQDEELQRVVIAYQSMWRAQPQYFCTAAESNDFFVVLNLIGSIHETSFEQLGGIIVFDLGLTKEQIQYLNDIEKVSVQKLELTHPDLLKQVKTNNAGRVALGWNAWKFVALKQALEAFPYVLWIDSDFTVLKKLDPLFNYIDKTGYFLCTIGDEKNNNKCLHSIGWSTTRHLEKTFNLSAPEKTYILDKEPLLSGVIGVSRKANDYLVAPLYECTKDLHLFEDDGTTVHGFGTGRSEQTVLSIFSYLHGLTIHQQDYTQRIPMFLNSDGENTEFYLTWHKQSINEKTFLYHSRGDLSNYVRYSRALRAACKNNEVVENAPQEPKIVALVPGRNESAFLYQHLKALSLLVDAIVYLDDASEDDSIKIVESIAVECKVEKIIQKEKWVRDEPGDRNMLLTAGRSIGGTHFVVLDADEMITAHSLDNNFLRNAILSLAPGDQLRLIWIQLWRSLDEYRCDDSVWTWNYKHFIFCDDKKCSYASDFIHTSRTPQNLQGKTFIMPGYDHGVMHFQFVNWRNLLIKQAWYRCLEHIRNPAKSIAEINALYAPSKNESGLRTVKTPKQWFSGYTFFDPSIYQKPEFWKETEIYSWFDRYGKKFFEDLDIWDIDWKPGLIDL